MVAVSLRVLVGAMTRLSHKLFSLTHLHLSFQKSLAYLYIMSQTYRFDVVTAFSASSLNISAEDFKAGNPNEFYSVSDAL